MSAPGELRGWERMLRRVRADLRSVIDPEERRRLRAVVERLEEGLVDARDDALLEARRDEADSRRDWR